MKRKNLWQKTFALVSIAAALCLLFAACPTDTDSGGGTTGGTVNKTGLASLIKEAEELKAEVKTSTDGTGLANGTPYASASAHTTFQTAIDAAKNVNNNASATQAQVDAAKAALQTAMNVFDTATDYAGAVRKSELNTLILQAEARIAEVDETEYADAITAFQAAIDTAKVVSGNPNATQEQVDAAKAALQTAMDEFNDATGAVKKSELNALISEAEAKIAGVEESEDGTGLDEGTPYASETAHTTFQAAIDTAKGVSDNPNATQPQVDAAKVALQAAMDAFDTATDYAGEVRKSELNTLISHAETMLAAVQESDDGTDLIGGGILYWAKAEDIEAFEGAIAAAKLVSEDPDATQGGVDNAQAALEDAISDFEDATKEAKYPIHYWPLTSDNASIGGKNFVRPDQDWVGYSLDNDWNRDVWWSADGGLANPCSIQNFDQSERMTEVTASFWIKPTDLSSTVSGRALQNLLTLGSGDYGLYNLSYYGGRIGLGHGAPPNDQGVTSTGANFGTIDAVDYEEVWTHFALTIKTGEAVLYINGVEFGKVTGTVTILDWDNWVAVPILIEAPQIDSLWIGGTDLHTKYLGCMSDLRLYDVVLTAEEIQAVMLEAPAAVQP